MKKLVISLLVLPTIFIACSKKEDDMNLYGTWKGQVKTSDLELLKLAGEGAQSNSALTTETVFFKFESGHITTYRTKDYIWDKNQIEREEGSYKVEEGNIDINISRHSCANIDEDAKKVVIDDKKTGKSIKGTYKVSKEELDLSIGLSTKIKFTKLTSDEAKLIDNQANSAEVGCFAKDKNGKPVFVKNPVQEPELSLDL